LEPLEKVGILSRVLLLQGFVSHCLFLLVNFPLPAFFLFVLFASEELGKEAFLLLFEFF
jgi:hypothetical protein